MNEFQVSGAARFVRVAVNIARLGFRIAAGTIRLVVGLGLGRSIRTVDSSGEVVDLYPGEYNEVRRDLVEGGPQ